MDDLARIALVGTSKQPAAADGDSPHPADTLVAAVASEDREHRFLLRAGARAAYEQCGWRPPGGITALEPAPPETLPIASSRILGLLQNAIASSSWDLLIEFLQQLAGLGLVLPPELLPASLGLGETGVREALLPVLGERGRWLSRLNSDWNWVTEGIGQLSSANRDELLQLWEEGNITQRCRALRALRLGAPADARERLEISFGKDSAEHRARLVECLAVSLGSDDEAFLEARLDDRSEHVRRAAVELLAKLPDSALAGRMRTRAEGMLAGEKKGLILQSFTLTCTPPEEIDKAWERDGIPKKVPTGVGKRAVWTETVLDLVPPGIWPETLGQPPEKLIQAIREDNFARSVLLGWTRAAARFAASDPASAAWLRPLWDYWTGFAIEGGGDEKKFRVVAEPLQALLGGMPGPAAEEAFRPILKAAAAGGAIDLLGYLTQIRRPWSPAFGTDYLKFARHAVKGEGDSRAYQWASSLRTAARALPKDCFAAALEPWEVAPESTASKWHSQAIVREVDLFTDTIQTRRSFFDELAATNPSTL